MSKFVEGSNVFVIKVRKSEQKSKLGENVICEVGVVEKLGIRSGVVNGQESSCCEPELILTQG